MVRDDVSGLIWEVKTNDTGFHDKDTKFTWQACQDSFIAQLNSSQFGDYSDWRLPTIKELATLTHKDKFSPAVNKNYFPNTIPDDYEASAYWSSTQSALNNEYAWCVWFDRGYARISEKSSQFYVRAVRGKQSIGNLVDNGDGTVTDTATGLMWQQAETGDMTWAAALGYCESLTLAGYSDWRLPNHNELLSIVDYTKNKPTIDTRFFPSTLTGPYWTSTTIVDLTVSAWTVEFWYGQIGDSFKTAGSYVRAVRSAQ